MSRPAYRPYLAVYTTTSSADVAAGFCYAEAASSTARIA